MVIATDPCAHRIRARLAGPVLAALKSAAVRSRDREACGVLLGRLAADGWVVRRVVNLPNRAADARSAFLLDGPAMRRAERRARRAGLDVVGVFHTHPAGPARPSAADRAGALPGYLQVVAAARAGRVCVTGWRLLDDRSGFARVSLARPALRPDPR
jgi:proteasome lid subunit RPN8/RPN11